jgi:mono/diheme cytochrome c family protein
MPAHGYTPCVSSPLSTCRFVVPNIFGVLLFLAGLSVWNSGTSTCGAENSRQASTIDYEKEVRPILVDNCLACHGADSETRYGGLRLDKREAALVGGDSQQQAIIPGKPDESELIRRITSADPDVVMPPSHHAEKLKPEQIEILKAWIAQGADYVEHWAFAPPQKANISDLGDGNVIDQLVSRKLASNGLSLSPEESTSILCRRLYLDLIGLPPTPQELDAYAKEGHEATVNKLLASPRYGEKWGRIWLDAARYSDTNGYEKDMKREQWIWRDWVIDAINNDMPYNQFIIEQIAGDLLPNATQSQMIATGFLRNSMINEEGAIVPEQFRMVEMFDRIDCVGKAVLGLTTQCAQCHTHKFDPLTHDEYFGMFAYLNNCYEAQSWVYTPEQLKKKEEILNAIQQQLDHAKSLRPQWSDEQQKWIDSVVLQMGDWTPVAFDDLNSVSGLNHPTQEHDMSVLMKGHTSEDVYMIGEPEWDGVTGLRLEILRHLDMPFGGPGRSSVGTWGIRELEVFVQKPGATAWDKLKLTNPTADFSEPENRNEKDKQASGPVALMIDGDNNTWWKADRGVGRRNSSSQAVLAFENPVTMEKGTRFKLVMRMTDMVGCCRVSLTKSTNPSAPAIDYDAIQAMRVASEQRSVVEQNTILSSWIQTVPELRPVHDGIGNLWKQYPNALTSVLHLVEREPTAARQTRLLNRGEWDQPTEPVAPKTPAAFHPMPTAADNAEPARLAFARWLVDPKSPLTSRVAVNRIWQSIFGVGIVETAEDFGTRTPVPEHKDVLDTLAADFVEGGWSQKDIIRKIVLSKTYKQSSKVSPKLMELDPNNTLLARGARFRCDAEVVRDIAMAVAGVLHNESGGPGVIPPVPQNVLDYNYVYPSYWKPAEGPQRYRRTVYNFRKRSMPDPAMSTLDAPNGDFSCVRRIRSNTPLAALTGLNEPIFVESAQALALRILKESPATDSDRIDYLSLVCLSRLPTDTEKKVLLDFLQSQRARVADGWLNPREIATGKPDRLPELPSGVSPQDAAVWVLAARVYLNLDETISKN